MIKWWTPTPPGELRPVPWLHPAAVGYLAQLLEKDWRVLEHGSGGSTLWLAERCATVTAVESDERYFESLAGRVSANVTLIPRKGDVPPGLGQFDLLLIDGDVTERGAWIAAAPQLVNAGGVVVLDNANRPEYEAERAKLKRHAAHFITLDVNPPHHLYCVTDLYRMGGGNIRWV